MPEAATAVHARSHQKHQDHTETLHQVRNRHASNLSASYKSFHMPYRYMKRRCGFLETLPAFIYNTGAGEYITDEQGKRVHTDTKQLGSTLMTAMLREVEDFCHPAIKENWSIKPHQQVTAHAITMDSVENSTSLLSLLASSTIVS